MNAEQLALIHETIAEGDIISAANLALVAGGVGTTVDNKEDALLALQTLEKNLHDEGMYREQAVLLWGNKMFNANPSPVREVFDEVSKHQKLLIMGSSGLSKTYSCGVLYYLYWRMDPYWTNVILCSTSESSLRGNLFSHIIALHQAAVIPMAVGEVKINNTDMEISAKGALPEMKIEGVLLKSGSDSSGSLRGRKPKPYRKEIHHKYQNSSRILILLDEATNIPDGAFEDLATTISAINPKTDNVKVVAAFNPIDISKKVVGMAEPEDGWEIEQVDNLHKWVSKLGWNVLRLDAKNFENIIERRTIYEGMQTYEAYLGFLKQGEKSAQYWALARGFPPLSDSAWTVIPPAWMQSQRGEPIFVDEVTTVAALDTALGGSDKAVLGVGRWGLAAGWINYKGEKVMFKDRLNAEVNKPRHVLVVDQIFELPKTDNTVDLVEGVIERCKNMGISPKHVSLDKTGNAAGVWGHATKFWGEVLGVGFNEKASESRVISEDLDTAYDRYDGKVTELWFAFKEWLNPAVNAVLLNNTLQVPELFAQMTNRRYRPVKGGKLRVEPKQEYKARTRLGSPDEADVVTLLVELVRQRFNVIPGMREIVPSERRQEPFQKVALKSVPEAGRLQSGGYVANKLKRDF